MKRMFYTLIIVLILAGGMFVGMVKGQEARTKWVSRMKGRLDTTPQKQQPARDEVVLDDIEMASFHSI
ncbi:MAG: hypothetical protein JNN29_04675 [Chitinophagaceae bacterium]|nr:hypothetical protein [Chitinophagaceae bacterium]MBN8666637.1 hypothetical protein [Chitinophagales bacterium]